jgi:hypothetical protein
MDQPSSSSPQREGATPQIDEVGRIASQMSWDDLSDISVQFGDDNDDDGVQSRDDDDDDLADEGPGIGHGAWVGGVWHDQIDPHHFATRESQSRLEFDLDYIPNPVQVMTMCN